MSMKYHPGKANMVVDALSKVSMGSVSHLEDDGKWKLSNEVHRYVRLGVKLNDTGNRGVMVLHGSEYSLIEDLKSKEDLDPTLVEEK